IPDGPSGCGLASIDRRTKYRRIRAPFGEALILQRAPSPARPRTMAEGAPRMGPRPLHCAPPARSPLKPPRLPPQGLSPPRPLPPSVLTPPPPLGRSEVLKRSAVFRRSNTTIPPRASVRTSITIAFCVVPLIAAAAASRV